MGFVNLLSKVTLIRRAALCPSGCLLTLTAECDRSHLQPQYSRGRGRKIVEFKVSLDYHFTNPARAIGQEPSSRKGKTRKAIKHCHISPSKGVPLCLPLFPRPQGPPHHHTGLSQGVLTPLLEEQGLIPRAHMAAGACH